jgi:hypothetical protein
MKKLFSKENLTAYAGLGLGSVAATLVEEKLVDTYVPETVGADVKSIIKGLTPIIAGVFTPTLIQGNFGQSLGDGMIAAGAASLTRFAIKKASPEFAGKLGIQGDVLLSGMDDMPSMMSGQPLMGNAGVDNFSGSSYDFTSASAGEMDF